ncbi:hypothetical protein [Undibacterium sp. Di24W]|uniref:hypothetical protein n=1 Tax=Undibacterium sp. Di24W TaxID=3413033 RepID=UPI003BF0C259
MAFYIKLRKTYEDEKLAKYSFESDGKNFGSLAIDKLNGNLTLLEALHGDDGSAQFIRAGAKLRKEWKEWKEGRFPEETEWAS